MEQQFGGNRLRASQKDKHNEELVTNNHFVYFYKIRLNITNMNLVIYLIKSIIIIIKETYYVYNVSNTTRNLFCHFYYELISVFLLKGVLLFTNGCPIHFFLSATLYHHDGPQFQCFKMMMAMIQRFLFLDHF